jgi:hypothetical protein
MITEEKFGKDGGVESGDGFDGVDVVISEVEDG